MLKRIHTTQAHESLTFETIDEIGVLKAARKRRNEYVDESLDAFRNWFSLWASATFTNSKPQS